MPKAQIEFSEEEILEMVMTEIQSRFEIEDAEEIEALAVVDRDENGDPRIGVIVKIDQEALDEDEDEEEEDD